MELLTAPLVPGDEPRPRLESHGDYIFGIFIVAVAVPDEDAVYYQEIDFVVTRGPAAHGHEDAAGRALVRHERPEGRLPAATSPSACTSSASSTRSPSASST